jgi:acetyl esterase/lipase
LVKLGLPTRAKVDADYSQISGTALYPDWFPQWVLDYAIKHSAIITAANYRLMPEATGLEILQDLADFWTWIHRDSEAHVNGIEPAIQPDLDRILCSGESAGGWLAIQSAITQPYGSIRAVIPSYPLVDLEADWFTKAFTKAPFGTPMLDPTIIDSHLNSIIPGKVISEAEPPARMPLAIATLQQGRFSELVGLDPRLYPMKAIEMVNRLPFIFIFHGADDSAVPVEGSQKFASRIRQKFSEEVVHIYVGPGEHGFDSTATLETTWLKVGLDKVSTLWLK